MPNAREGVIARRSSEVQVSSLPRRCVRRSALSLTALLALAPIWTACAQEFGQLPTPGSRQPAVNDALRLGDGDSTSFDGASTPPGGDLGGLSAQDAMDLRSGAANYGKPVTRKPGQKPPRKMPTPALRPLVPYPTSAEARRAAKLDHLPAPGDADYIAPSPTTAAPPLIPVRTRPKVEDKPYAPIGIDVGLLRVKPYFESDIGYNDNPGGTPNRIATPSAFTRQEMGVAAESDWSNHSFTGRLRLGYNDYFNAHYSDAPDGAGGFLLRLDVARDLKINVDGLYSVSTQGANSPNIINAGQLKNRPIIAILGGGLGVSKTFNRLELTLRGSVERDYWQDAYFTDGFTQNLSAYSYDAYGVGGRASYELTPGVKPFVEANVDTRLHDGAFWRDSTGVQARAGSTFEITRLLTGVVSVGYGQRNYRDPLLIPLRGPLLDSSLLWTATPLTRVTLRGTTTMDETTIPLSPGALTHAVNLQVAHDLMRNVTLTAMGGFTTSRYEGVNLIQTTYQSGLLAEYSLTRSVVIKGSFTHQRLDSNQPGSDYTANIIMVGLRLQR
ncbi:outer membrane beta-barrel protein [Rhodoblastus acidophilus]|uniref:Outer membrane beta-barrel protein n=1 Tax=Rhodoblastus acidophilus TaxID=1074 RepID=A0A6N8DLH5_RHOAC|nr:outer membrane beta-barrel protein [Rhodoblastus acidophilus]